MPTNRLAFHALLAAGLTGTAVGQLPLTLTDANVAFTLTSLPSDGSSPGGVSSFTANAATSPDILLQHNWVYRVTGDTHETVLNGGGGQTIHVIQLRSDFALLQWTNVDSRGLFTAVWHLQAVSTGPNAGLLVSRMSLINVSQNAVGVDMFSYADIDLCGSAGNQAVAANGSNTRQRITNSSRCANETVEFAGIGAGRWEVLRFSQLRAKLLDTSRDDLTNSGLPFGPDDYTAATQWTRTIPSGGFATFVTVIAHNDEVCERQALSANYGRGTAGTNGVPSIGDFRQPIIGSVAEIAVAGGLPNGAGVIIAGVGRTQLQIGNVTLWTQPIANGPIVFDASGAASLPLRVPDLANLCGARLQFQCLISDPGVQGVYPVAHTDGLEWTLGGF